MKKTPVLKKEIQYRLVSIEKLGYFENDLRDFSLTENDINKAEIELNYSLEFGEKDDSISIIINSLFKDPSKSYKLFGLKALYKFQIRYLSKKYKHSENNQYRLPDELMHTLLNMSISGVRGMLSILTTNHVYKRLILPPINTIDLLPAIKAKKKKNNSP